MKRLCIHNIDVQIFLWKMQEEQFCFDVRLLQVGGCDLVLGMDRTDVFSPVVLSTTLHSLSQCCERHSPFVKGDKARRSEIGKIWRQ